MVLKNLAQLSSKKNNPPPPEYATYFLYKKGTVSEIYDT